MRAAFVLLAVAVFLGISFLVARWLNTDTVERTRIVRLLEAQARGDVAATVRALDCPDAACAALARANARRLRTPGTVEIVRFDSPNAHALGDARAQVRVVWRTPSRLPTVQCVLVERSGSALTGPSVSLQRLSAPIGREAGCPG